MTLQEYNIIKGLREEGKSYKDVIIELKMDATVSSLKSKYNRAVKKYDTTNHTIGSSQQVEVIAEKVRPRVIHHDNFFNVEDMHLLKEMLDNYKLQKTSCDIPHDIHNWDLPSEYKKIKNTQVSLRLNKTLFDDLKKEIHKIDLDVKITDIINKAMSALLISLK